jgi:AcrR family transcriptional regulator
MAKINYHHGNLREALLVSAHRILVADGVGGLSLRKVAKHTGVSATALYSHFKDKRELLAVLASEGFEQLSASMLAAAGKPAADKRDAGLDLSGLALGYVSFATANDALFQLMFGREVGNLMDYPFLVESGSRCYALMAQSVAGQLKDRGSPDNPAVAATAAWSMVHGLATLINDGRIEPGTCGASSNEEMVLQLCRTFTFARQ